MLNETQQASLERAVDFVEEVAEATTAGKRKGGVYDEALLRTGLFTALTAMEALLEENAEEAARDKVALRQFGKTLNFQRLYGSDPDALRATFDVHFPWMLPSDREAMRRGYRYVDFYDDDRLDAMYYGIDPAFPVGEHWSARVPWARNRFADVEVGDEDDCGA